MAGSHSTTVNCVSRAGKNRYGTLISGGPAHVGMVDKHTNIQTDARRLTAPKTTEKHSTKLPIRGWTQDSHSHTDSFPGCTHIHQRCSDTHSLRQPMACSHVVRPDSRWMVNPLTHAAWAQMPYMLMHTRTHVHTDIHSVRRPLAHSLNPVISVRAP